MTNSKLLSTAVVRSIREVNCTELLEDENNLDFCQLHAHLSNCKEKTFILYCTGWVSSQAKKSKTISQEFKELIITAAGEGTGGSDLGWLWLYVN